MKREKKKAEGILYKGKIFNVPASGSIGILALGNVGVRAWRKAMEDQENKKKK